MASEYFDPERLRPKFSNKSINASLIPSAPSGCNKHADNVFKFFNGNMLVINHKYIFDPYALFFKHDNAPATVSSLSHSPGGLKFIFPDNRTADLGIDLNQVKKTYDTRHTELEERYQTMMKILAFAGEQILDYSNKADMSEWFKKHVKSFLSTPKANKLGSLRLFFRKTDSSCSGNDDESFYETLFLDFAAFVCDFLGQLGVCKRSKRIHLKTKDLPFVFTTSPNLRFYSNVFNIVQYDLSSCHFKERETNILFVTVRKPMGKRLDPTAESGICNSNSSDEEKHTGRCTHKRKREISPAGPFLLGDEITEEKSAIDLEMPVVTDASEGPQYEATEDSEEMFEDVEKESKNYRYLKTREKEAIRTFIAQLLGEMLFLFDHGEDLFPHTQRGVYKNKNIRYGIGILGIRVMFVGVCFVDQMLKLKSMPTMQDMLASAKPGNDLNLRTDIFMTRQFNLLKHKDRKCIADILFAVGRAQEKLAFVKK